ncbi:hypothetical protein FSP39_004919 [Pinctada imbricata]|uniref:Transcriptional repressor p66 coiled-coil MBD2-interaction domain-containing protein n=1 Tax=Pinctada imbricata TaxID=66713 RepID=A0AA88YHE6_PINIB|nr:hypothetical protein FSP39_004919 [Pinctada imbricata]
MRLFFKGTLCYDRTNGQTTCDSRRNGRRHFAVWMARYHLDIQQRVVGRFEQRVRMSADSQDDPPPTNSTEDDTTDNVDNVEKEEDILKEDNSIDDKTEEILDESIKRKRDEEENVDEKSEPPEKRSKSETDTAEYTKDIITSDDLGKEKDEGNESPEELTKDSTQSSKDATEEGDSAQVDSKESENSAKIVENGEKEEEEEDVDKGVDEEESITKTEDDQSSAKSEDSEKENRQVGSEMPMDLSTKSSNDNSQDVIMLSDSDEEPLTNGYMNGYTNGEFTRDEIRSRKKLLKQLQAELRNEEAKLVLLKKLRQSQISTSQQIQEMSRQSKSAQPPPLVRPGQQQGSGQARPAHSQPPQLLRGNQGMSNRAHQQGPPPLVNMRGQNTDNRNSLSQQMRYQGMQGSSPNAFRQGSNSQSQQVAGATSQQPIDTQTPAQRQAAAKMALRKQLEKTLLQIPPPKPPPPEMNFVPSLSSPDFIYLLGLEEAVNYIIDANLISKGQKNPDEKMVCNPFTCVQCNTDFTPVWKREKVGSKNVICEHCVTTNQKKALKQEHTNRLKSAFVKALQQEQEIERMQAQEKTTGNQTSSETLRQHQNFLQAHQAAAAHQTALRMGQPLGLAPFAAAAAAARNFPYQMPFGSQKDLTQLQRQYLLDMIPNRGGMPWKT